MNISIFLLDIPVILKKLIKTTTAAENRISTSK